MGKELLQSGAWVMKTSIRLEVVCPHCNHQLEYKGRNNYSKNDHIYCNKCTMTFRLGPAGQKITI